VKLSHLLCIAVMPVITEDNKRSKCWLVEQYLQQNYVNSWDLWSSLVFPSSNLAPSHPRSTAHRLATTAVVNLCVTEVISDKAYCMFETVWKCMAKCILASHVGSVLERFSVQLTARSRVLLEKLTVSYLIKNSLPYETTTGSLLCS
jgi:hypothetical protein